MVKAETDLPLRLADMRPMYEARKIPSSTRLYTPQGECLWEGRMIVTHTAMKDNSKRLEEIKAAWKDLTRAIRTPLKEIDRLDNVYTGRVAAFLKSGKPAEDPETAREILRETAARRQRQDAERVARRIRKKGPFAPAEANLLWGRALLLSGDAVTAEEVLSRVASGKESPFTWEAGLSRAEAFACLKRFDEAEALLARLAADPDAPADAADRIDTSQRLVQSIKVIIKP